MAETRSDEDTLHEGPPISRRRVLALGGALVVGIGLGIGLGEPLFSDDGPEKRNVDTVNGIIRDGLAKWLNVVVAPAFLVAGPGTKFFHDASLTQHADAPISGDQRLGLQRPFLVRETLGLNYFDCASLGNKADAVAKNNPLIPGTLAFLPPDNKNGDYLYAPFDAETIDVYLRNNYDLGHDVSAAMGLPGQQTRLDGRHPQAAQAVPYLETDGNYKAHKIAKGKYSHTLTSEYRLCAVSQLYQGALEAKNNGDYYASAQTSSPQNDPIVIPDFMQRTHSYDPYKFQYDNGC